MEEQIYLNIREIYTQIIILLKPSWLYVHLKSNTMSLYSSICTHSVGGECIFNTSNIPPLFNFHNLWHYFIFAVHVKIFEVSQKSK